MGKVLVVYYSKKGSTKFLANRIAELIGADLEELKPRLDNMLFVALGIEGGLKRLKHQPSDYDKVVLCGPVWMGMVLSPMKRFIKKYREGISSLYYLISCASDETSRDDKFGYGTVAKKVEEICGASLKAWDYYSVLDVLSVEERKNDQLVMNTRLNVNNFKGKVAEKLDTFIKINLQ